MEASETRGTTALVYCLISSSLYTGTVQGWWSTPPTGLTVSRGEVHPNWSDGQQGRSQLSTSHYRYSYINISGWWYFSKNCLLQLAILIFYYIVRPLKKVVMIIVLNICALCSGLFIYCIYLVPDTPYSGKLVLL